MSGPVLAYTLGKVSTTPPASSGLDKYTGKDLETATQYAGLPIILSALPKGASKPTAPVTPPPAAGSDDELLYIDFYANADGAIGGDGKADIPYDTIKRKEAQALVDATSEKPEVWDDSKGSKYKVTYSIVNLTAGYYTGKPSLKAVKGTEWTIDDEDED